MRYKIIKYNVHSDFNKKWLDSSNKRHSSGGASLVPALIWSTYEVVRVGCGGHSGTAAGLCRPLRFLFANYHATSVAAVIYHQGLVNLDRLRPQPYESLALPPADKNWMKRSLFRTRQSLIWSKDSQPLATSRSSRTTFTKAYHRTIFRANSIQQNPSQPIYLTNGTF